jgi:iron-sulfur cluster repair protein YtfE (RIC family)
MDLYQMLIQDHRAVDDLFDKIENSEKNAIETRQRLVEKLREELELHAQVEERIVYPAFKKHEGVRDFIDESQKEHGEIKRTLQILGRMSPEAADWTERLDQLESAVEHHVREEEEKVFPAARKEIGEDEAADLARRVQEMKQKATS